jgi:hypothetical protein
MMSIQLKIWKRLITNQIPLSSHHALEGISLLPPPLFYAKPHLKFPSFYIETTILDITLSDKGVFIAFFLECGLT